MSDANRSPQPRHVSLLENVSHQTVTLTNTQGALVIGCDTGGVLTSMLQHGQCVVYRLIDRTTANDSNDGAHRACSGSMQRDKCLEPTGV